MINEIVTISLESATHLRHSCVSALRVGLRLICLHKKTGDSDAPGGFRAALDAIEGLDISRSTAYRWINAASLVLARAQGETDVTELRIPTERGSDEWTEAESILENAANGMSLRRLMLGSAATGDESRMHSLITDAEAGDPHAAAMLDKVAAGEITLVQAIRAAAGAKATKGKERHDPIYLDIDGHTGQLRGLFPKCLVTLANTFARWDSLDESARAEARKSWKALAVNLPKDLR
jgi:hypothetical protein